MHHTPKHCLVNGGFQLYFGAKATCFKWLQNGDLLRSPVYRGWQDRDGMNPRKTTGGFLGAAVPVHSHIP